MELKCTRFSLVEFVRKNVFNPSAFAGSPSDLLYLWGKGFDTASIRLHSLKRSNCEHYLPDNVRHKITLGTNSGYWPILHDKMIFYEFMKSELPTPELVATIFNGKHRVHRDAEGEISSIVHSDKEYVIKPLQGGRGEGIQFIRRNSEGGKHLDGRPLTEATFLELAASLTKSGVFRYYEQHPRLAAIYPHSANSIRLVTLMDVEENKPFIFVGLLRIGWSGSRPFDNFSQGGLVAMIDGRTGGVGKWKRKNAHGYLEEGVSHPDTGTRIEAVVIPHWAEIKGRVLAFIERNPIFDYVGWDILVTDDGFQVIEANHNPDIDLVQIHKPFLSEPRALRFFRSRNIVR